MSEINKMELSEQELDVVAGGAGDSTFLQEQLIFKASQENIKSASAATPFGAFSATDVQDVDVESVVQKIAEA
jgi:hypothetical protein